MARDELGAAIDRSDLRAHETILRSLAQPAGYLEVVPGTAGDAAGSRLGGEPWLPAGVEWPVDDRGRPMRFVLQIAVGDVPREYAGAALRPASWPEGGHLLLFTGPSASSWPLPHRVLLTAPADGGVRAAPAAPSTDGHEVDFVEVVPTARLVVHAGWDVPRWASREWAHLDEEVFDGEDDAVGFETLAALLEPVPALDCIGRVLGHVAGVGADVRDDIGGEVPAGSWRHLLTIDSSLRVDLTIADAGYLQVLAMADAIATGDLDGTVASVESS